MKDCCEASMFPSRVWKGTPLAPSRGGALIVVVAKGMAVGVLGKGIEAKYYYYKDLKFYLYLRV